MNIKELSVGDFVEYNGEPVMIVGLSSDGMVTLGVSEYLNLTCGVCRLTPIPLSPKILEKNGFIQLEPSVNYDWWCLDDKDKFLVGFGFGKEEGHTATGWEFDTVGSCDYKRPIGVHELQNLLRLAGLDLELKVC